MEATGYAPVPGWRSDGQLEAWIRIGNITWGPDGNFASRDEAHAAGRALPNNSWRPGNNKPGRSRVRMFRQPVRSLSTFDETDDKQQDDCTDHGGNQGPDQTAAQ